MTQLSEKLKVSPIKPGEIVLFRLLNAGQVDPATGQPAYQRAVGLPGVVDIYDEGDNNRKTIKNIVGTHVNSLTKEIEETVSGVDFNEYGEIACRAEDVNTYMFLKRHPLNDSNPFRPKNTPAKFYEVDDRKVALEENAKEDLMIDALDLVRKMPEAELRAYARTFPSVDAKADIDVLRYAMKVPAKANPKEFIRNSNSETTKVRGYVKDAQEEQVLDYDAISRTWGWSGSYSPFLTVPPGKDYETHLVEFLMDGSNQGKAVLKEMKRKLMIPDITTAQVILEESTPVVKATKQAPVRKTAKGKTAKGKAPKEKPDTDAKAE
jgi:hypothetical protein